MTLVIPTGYAQASVEMRAAGDPDPWYCTFGLDISAVGGDLEAVADSFMAAWYNAFGQELQDNVVNTAVNLVVGQDGPDNLIYRKAYNNPGLSDAPKLPQNCALLVTKNSGLGGRTNRGRFYVPSILSDTTVTNTGVIDAGLVTVYDTIANTFLGVLETGGIDPEAVAIPMVILHNQDSPAAIPTPVTSLSCSGVISTQRRRLR